MKEYILYGAVKSERTENRIKVLGGGNTRLL